MSSFDIGSVLCHIIFENELTCMIFNRSGTGVPVSDLN